ncbi:hypothetical protein [Chitinimonas sp. JJ19]|uniref:hypothetical protein n=1 Tax=Chitinimonas sp. JJ19 TaxID=3109352 RepID=UPI002FFFB32E
MARPYYMRCTVESVGLFELSDGRFQLIRTGPVAPLVTGPGYVLAEHALAEFLMHSSVSAVRFEPAVIWHRSANVEHHTHKRLIIGHYFSADQIDDLNLDGNRLLILDDEYLFASPSLMHCFNQTEFSYLEFSEGLSSFAT